MMLHNNTNLKCVVDIVGYQRVLYCRYRSCKFFKSIFQRLVLVTARSIFPEKDGIRKQGRQTGDKDGRRETELITKEGIISIYLCSEAQYSGTILGIIKLLKTGCVSRDGVQYLLHYWMHFCGSLNFWKMNQKDCELLSWLQIRDPNLFICGDTYWLSRNPPCGCRQYAKHRRHRCFVSLSVHVSHIFRDKKGENKVTRVGIKEKGRTIIVFDVSKIERHPDATKKRIVSWIPWKGCGEHSLDQSNRK